MSSRVVIKTLKFCTTELCNLEHAMSILCLPYNITSKQILVGNLDIKIQNDSYYISVDERNKTAIAEFNKINGKLAEIESQLRSQKIELAKLEQQKSREREQMYKVRQLKAEEDRLEYERKKLELEKQSFAESKKQAIIQKAKEKGYSVQETIEDGKIKLKLVKRLY